MHTPARDQASPECPTPQGEAPDEPWYKLMGPGLVTGAADDDPSGIVTYAQAGAQFGNGLLWSLLLTLPLMIAMQLVCARLGRLATTCWSWSPSSARPSALTCSCGRRPRKSRKWR